MAIPAPPPDPLSSAAALIRSLKAPALTPQAKIDVALAAWTKDELYIPAKRGLFMDWAVGTMAGAGVQAGAAGKKGKGKEKELAAAPEGLDASPLTSKKYWQLLDLLLAPSSVDPSSAAAILPPALSSLLTQLFKQLGASPGAGSAGQPSAESYADLLATVASPARKLLGLVPNVAEALLDLLGEALACWSTLALPEALADEAWADVLGVLIEELEEVLPNNLTRRKIAQALVKSPSLPHIISLLGTLAPSSPLKGAFLHVLSSLLLPVDVLKAYVAPVQPPPPPPRSNGKQKAPVAAAPKPAAETAPEEKAVFKLLATLLGSAPSSTLSFLPELLEIYTQLLATHRHALFPLPPHLRIPAEVHASDLISKATLRFVAALSTPMNEAPRAGSGAERWACRKGIWAVVEDRGKVGRGYEEASAGFGEVGSGGWRAEAKGVLEGGVKRLEGLQGQADADAERDQLIATLATLGRMDRELMDPFLKRFLVAVATIPTPHAPTVDFLGSLQDYHRQTRTLPAFVALLYSVIPTAALAADQATYRLISHGPLFDNGFQTQLGKGLSGFLGVQGQIAEGLEELKEVFRTAIADARTALAAAPLAPEAANDDGERKKKKRKTKPTSCGPATAAAVALSLLSRLARTFLLSAANLLTTNLPTALLASLTGLYQDILDDVARPLISLGLDSASDWAGEMILVSGLRVWSSVKAVVDSPENDLDEGVVGRLGKIAADKSTGGEAVYEVTHVLLRNLLLPSLDAFSHEKIIDSALYLLSKSASDSDEWSGWASDLDDASGRRKGSLSIATWSVLVERGGEWLGVIDFRASPEQLKKLAHLIISSYHSVAQASTRAHTLHTLTNLLLRQPPFAELTSLRQHILGALETYTDMSSGSPSTSQSSAYDFLLSMPIEYLPKQQRADLAQRALKLERAVKLMSAQGAAPQELADRRQAREVLRRFSATVFREANVIGSVAVDQSILDYLMVQDPSDYLEEDSPLSKSLERSTKSLLESSYRSILRRGAKDEVARLVGRAFHEDVLAPFQDSMASLDPEVLAEDGDSTTVIDFPVRSALLLLSTIKDEVREPSQLGSDLDLAAKAEELLSTLEEGLQHLAQNADARALVDSDSIPALVDLVSALTMVKSFLHWLGAKPSASKLTSHLTNLGVTVQDPTTALASAVIELRVTELQAVSETERPAAIENLAASWLVFYGTCLLQANDVALLTAALQAFSKTLNAAERTAVVQSFVETSVSPSAPAKLVEAALAGANHIFKDGAELSNRSIVTSLLDAGRLLINHPASWEVVSQVVQAMGTICSDKASHLQLQDVGVILSILCLALAPRTSVAIPPSAKTLASVFHQIATATTFLVRHRRDLVVHSSPHLAAVLEHLIGCLRAVRPNLGGRQHRLLANSLPGWLNVSAQPLGASEAKALARLLTSLTAKTIPRVPAHLQAAASNQKADSLAGPLAKHAPFLLLAYVRLLTDLSSVVSPLLRRELEPGVGAVCEMVGDRDRDAIMVGGGLNAGGKGVLKMVWNEWDSKRYAGRG